MRRMAIRVGVLGAILMISIPGTAAPSGNVNRSESTVSEPLPTAKPYRPRYNMWNAYAGALYLSGGFSQEFKYNSVLGGKMILDYMVSNKVSVGLQSGLYVQSKADGRAKSPYLGARVSYHFMEAGWRPRQNHWNVYVGVSAEIEAGGGSKDWHEKSFVGDLHLGARYRLSERWFIWGEAAINNVSLGLTYAL